MSCYYANYAMYCCNTWHCLSIQMKFESSKSSVGDESGWADHSWRGWLDAINNWRSGYMSFVQFPEPLVSPRGSDCLHCSLVVELMLPVHCKASSLTVTLGSIQTLSIKYMYIMVNIGMCFCNMSCCMYLHACSLSSMHSPDHSPHQVLCIFNKHHISLHRTV